MKEKFIVIADIHGQLNSFTAVTSYAKDNFSDYSLILLGDYVDRGSQSADVIQHILDLKSENAFREIITLSGNHEQFFLRVIKNPNDKFAQVWAEKLGGYQTLFSYGWEIDDPFNFTMIPSDHIDFLQNLMFSYETEKFFFCHAGVNPEISLEKQTPEELISIRDRFLTDSRKYEKTIVHGHTPTEITKIKIDNQNRLNLDTGSAFKNNVTAAVIDSDLNLIHARDGMITVTPYEIGYNRLIF